MKDNIIKGFEFEGTLYRTAAEAISALKAAPAGPEPKYIYRIWLSPDGRELGRKKYFSCGETCCTVAYCDYVIGKEILSNNGQK